MLGETGGSRRVEGEDADRQMIRAAREEGWTGRAVDINEIVGGIANPISVS